MVKSTIDFLKPRIGVMIAFAILALLALGLLWIQFRYPLALNMDGGNNAANTLAIMNGQSMPFSRFSYSTLCAVRPFWFHSRECPRWHQDCDDHLTRCCRVPDLCLHKTHIEGRCCPDCSASWVVCLAWSVFIPTRVFETNCFFAIPGRWTHEFVSCL